MSYVLTKEQADHYFVDYHNDDLIFNDEFVNYTMDNPYVFGLDMPIDRYLGTAYDYKKPEYQLSYIKRILFDYEKMLNTVVNLLNGVMNSKRCGSLRTLKRAVLTALYTI